MVVSRTIWTFGAKSAASCPLPLPASVRVYGATEDCIVGGVKEELAQSADGIARSHFLAIGYELVVRGEGDARLRLELARDRRGCRVVRDVDVVGRPGVFLSL